MKVWVDLATPPQVLFFRPVLRELARRGHETVVTTRDFSQTVALADRLGFEHTTLGRHGGRSLLGKGLEILRRTAQLVAFARGSGIDLAVSHNSYAQALAGALLRLPLATLMDYEYQPANHIAFRLARRVIVPQIFPAEVLRRCGARAQRVRRYAGIKQDVYLADFTPAPRFLAELGVPADKVVVTMRPPATMATYHHFENPLFDQVLAYLLEQAQVHVVLLPRVTEQAQDLAARYPDNLLIPAGAVDGPNLIYHSDLVISAGGTMNREAAVLGTPVYTVYKGRMGAIDRHLIETGRMTLLANPADVSKIRVTKKRTAGTSGRPDVLRQVVDMILETPRP